MSKKRSFFERLTGGVRLDDEEEVEIETSKFRGREKEQVTIKPKELDERDPKWLEEEEPEGELTVDVYQTPNDIIIQTFVAGVRPEDLEINISRDMVTIRGRREDKREVSEDGHFIQELYWGSFSRTLLLPQEIEPEEAEAIEKHGLLMIKLPKIDKDRRTSLKVKSI